MNDDRLHRLERYEPRRALGNGSPPSGEDDYGARMVEKPNFRTLKEFCAEYAPVSYSVAGLVRSGSLYTLTARTGDGKTSWLVTASLSIAAGKKDILGRDVTEGRVAFCTAENPDDLRMRLSVASYTWNIDQAALGRSLIVSDNRVRPEEIHGYLEREAEHGPFAFIVVDTWQAYFDGRDANHPTEAVDFTRRFRPLTRLPGSPAVVVAAHPIKNASNDNLIPYGGGSTLNEVDGNFTLARQPTTGYFEFWWQGKIRGAHFEPFSYRIDKLTSPDIVDINGTEVAMPVMFPVTAEDVEAREASTVNRDAALLKAMSENQNGSMQAWANASGQNKRAVQTALQGRLKKGRLVEKSLGKWSLTSKARKALRDASEGRTDVGTTSDAGTAYADA
jgi:RecA-family ATPase